MIIKGEKSKTAIRIVGFLVAICVAGFGGFFAGKLVSRDSKYDEIIGIIERNYLYDFDKSAIKDGEYSGILSSLGDDYSYYYNPTAAKEKQSSDKGNQTRLGIVLCLHPDNKKVFISNVQSQSSAAKAGLKKGDMILSINGTSTDGKSTSECVDLVDKTIGAKNTLVVNRGGEKLEMSAEMIEFTEDSVTFRQIGNIGYVKIHDFTSATPKQFNTAIDTLQKANVSGVIYDLRDNLGGLTAALGDVLNRILPKGDAVRAKYKSDIIVVTEKTTDEQSFPVPTVVLTNGSSASAAELFALAIRDYGAGVLLGEKTYGKGVMQTSYSLSDGSIIKLTTAELCDKNGKTYNKKGIMPDIECVPSDYEKKFKYFLSEEQDSQLQAAIKYLNK